MKLTVSNIWDLLWDFTLLNYETAVGSKQFIGRTDGTI